MAKRVLVSAVAFINNIGIGVIDGKEQLCAELARMQIYSEQARNLTADELTQLTLDNRTVGYLPANLKQLGGMIGSGSYTGGSLAHLRSAQSILRLEVEAILKNEKRLEDFSRLPNRSPQQRPGPQPKR